MRLHRAALVSGGKRENIVLTKNSLENSDCMFHVSVCNKNKAGDDNALY